MASKKSVSSVKSVVEIRSVSHVPTRERHNRPLDRAGLPAPNTTPFPAVKTEPKTKPAADLPLPVLAEELAFLRKTFRDLLAAYGTAVEGEITHLQTLVNAEAASKKKLPASRTHDLRDMLMLLRSLEVKPAKGRRRDLKRLENSVAELREIADRWE